MWPAVAAILNTLRDFCFHDLYPSSTLFSTTVNIFQFFFYKPCSLLHVERVEEFLALKAHEQFMAIIGGRETLGDMSAGC